MVDRRDLGGWLQGPDRSSVPESTFPGERLGRPESGSRSIAGFGRRLAALVIDWAVCAIIARAVFGPAAFQHSGQLSINGILVLENLLLIGTAGATLGQRLLSLRVERIDGRRLGLVETVVRSILLGIGFPAFTALWESDHRGLHELLSGSLVALR